MKITFVLSQYDRISGGNRVLLEYANRLHGLGNEVNLFVMAKPARWYRIDHWPRIISKKVVTLPPDSIDWMENGIPINILSYNSQKFIPDADILFATAWQTAQFANSFSKSKGKKFYFVQHHESLWTREKNRAQETYTMPFNKLVVSTWLKDVLRENYQQESEVFINPVNENLFYREGNNASNGSRVCFLHHDYDWKGYKDAIEAVKILKSLNYEIEPVVFGEKLQDPSHLYEEAGFNFEYHYRPTGETLRRIYVSCDIFLCASWYEGSGLPAMEAMSCGVAVVTTDTGGSRDYAFDGKTALVSPPRQPKQLADNLARLLDDIEFRKRLMTGGSQKIKEFSWETNSLRLERLFKEALT